MVPLLILFALIHAAEFNWSNFQAQDGQGYMSIGAGYWVTPYFSITCLLILKKV